MTDINWTNSWYVLYTRPKFEKSIVDAIISMNHRCYLPLIKRVRKWSDRHVTIHEPLFKNYVFVKAPLSEKIIFLRIPGVVRYVLTDGKPAPIAEEEINKINLIEMNCENLAHEPFFSVGDKVKVISGIFCGLEGILIRTIKQPRLVVKIPLLRQAVSVEIETNVVVKIV